ncbi:MAG: S8 family serine peptidase [Gemmatimonadetes bacterium]|nr:S8 family serine peptidase [Gemmatimonadota bacterium]
MRRLAVSLLAAGTLAGWPLSRHRESVATPAEPENPAAAVWVFLEPDSVASATAPAVSAAVLARRQQRGIPALPGDRPIPGHLVERVAGTGARIRHVSRWLRAISVEADSAAVARIAALPFVTALRPIAKLTRANGGPSPHTRLSGSHAVPLTLAAARQTPDSTFYGANWSAFRELGVPTAHAFSFRGAGVRIAILDTGFDPRHESLLGRRVVAARDFINGDTIVYNQPGDPATIDQARHGTQVWSLISAFRPGTLVGVAYGAEIVLAKVDAEPGNTQADEDRWVAAVEWAADSMDANIIASSVVFRTFTDRPPILYDALNGDSTITTRVADMAARRGVLFVTAVGNDGPAPGSLGSPADGDSVLAVGAVAADGSPATFGAQATARGPTADGRLKPDVAARGVGITAATSVSLSGYEISLSGTSYPTALVAAGAALVMEAWPQLSTSAIQRAIVQSARNAQDPDNARGRGVPDVSAAILFPDGLVPTNVATLDLQGAVTTIAPVLNWRASLVKAEMRPVSYRVEIASDSLFNSIVYTDTLSEAFSLTTRRALKPAPRLHWRILATAQLGITTRSVRGTPFSVPSWVRLLAPAGNEVTFVNTPRPDLSWAPLNAPPPIGPLVYDVEVFSHETGLPAQPALRNVTASTVQVAQPLVPNTAYRWRVIARTQTGQTDTVESVAPFVVTSETQPPATLLYQNFPNPFPRVDLGEEATHIWFDLAAPSAVELSVLDLRGRLIRRLIPADPSCGTVQLEAGIYGRGVGTPDACMSTTWDGRDQQGRVVPRGIYILRLRAAGRVDSRRMLFLPG